MRFKSIIQLVFFPIEYWILTPALTKARISEYETENILPKLGIVCINTCTYIHVYGVTQLNQTRMKGLIKKVSYSLD